MTVAGFNQVTSIAVVGWTLYWTTVYLGRTMFTPSLQRADLGDLRRAGRLHLVSREDLRAALAAVPASPPQ